MTSIMKLKKRMLPSNAYGIGAWDHHILLVYKPAIENHKEYDTNQNIVALASLIHDIVTVINKEYTENHHIIGAQIAEKLLDNYNLNKEQLELIKKCILNHRGSILKKKTTPEEICIAASDAISHFYSIPSLFRMVYIEKNVH